MCAKHKRNTTLASVNITVDLETTYHTVGQFHSTCCPLDRLDDHLPLEQSHHYKCRWSWT